VDDSQNISRRTVLGAGLSAPLAGLLAPGNGESMAGSAPVVTLAADQASYDPGTPATVTATITDADNQTETLTTTGTDALGLDVTQVETITRKDHFTIEWSVDGQPQPDLNNMTTVTITVPTADAGSTMTVGALVTDRQHHTATASLTLPVTKPASGMAFGCAVNKLPSPSTLTRTQRWNAFTAAIGTAPRLLRVYLSPSDTARLLTMYEANPTRTDFWPLTANPDSAGDIWTPGTPHPHDVLLSWKPNVDDYLAGRYDGLTRAVASQYPGPGLLRWTAYHEPYDDVAAGSLNLAKWQAVISRHMDLTDQFNHVNIWVVLTGEQFETQFQGTAKDPDRFYVLGVHGVAGDRYNVPSVKHDGSTWWTPQRMFDPYTAWCQEKNVAAGLWEYGAAADFADSAHRSRDLLAVVGYCEVAEYEVLSWFDATGPKGDWQVDSIIHRDSYYPNAIGAVQSITSDPTSAQTWHDIVRGQ